MEPDPQPEARVVVNGTVVEGNEALFVGSLEDARAFVLALAAEEQAQVSIVTDGRVYDPHEL